MKPKTLILMVVAVACGLGASYMTSRLLAERQHSDVEQERVRILVAKKNLETGAAIKKVEDLFDFKDVLKEEILNNNAIVDPALLKDQQLRHSLRQGDFITPEDLVGKDGGISYYLPKGFRAIGIRVTPDAIAGGFASLPYSHVDIIHSVRKGDDKGTFAHVLLENVLVLAADTTTTRDENGKAMPANVVTVALKPEDAVKLELAKQGGQMSLMLRKANDDIKSGENRLSMQELYTGKGDESDVESVTSAPAPAPVAVEPKPAPAPVTVAIAPPVPKVVPLPGRDIFLTIIQGTKEERQTYRVDDNDHVIPTAPVPPVPQVTAQQAPTNAAPANNQQQPETRPVSPPLPQGGEDELD